MPYNNKHIKGWVRVLILIFPYLLVVGMFGLLGHLITGVSITDIDAIKTTFQGFIISLFNFIGTLIIIPIFVKVIDNENFIDIGLKINKHILDIIVGTFIGLFIMLFGLLLLLSLDEIIFVKFNKDIINLLYLFLYFVFISLIEEIFFRGYILRNFMYSFNKPTALILSSLLFSFAHGINPNFDFQAFINLFLAGILLGISYTYTKNLWFPIALHFSWNFFQSLFGFKVSGVESYSLIEFSIPEPNIINGGEFGFEGSILSIIAQIILIIMIYVWYRKKQNKSEYLL